MIKDANLKVDGLKIAGQLYLPENGQPAYPAVILCHGIPSGTVDPTDGGYPLLARTFSAQGFAAYTFRFRGSGESEGNFDIAGWSRDLEAAIDFLSKQPEIDKSHLALVGFSAGASLSIWTAAGDRRVSAVVACASPADFSSISDSGKNNMTLSYFRKIGIFRDPNFPADQQQWFKHFQQINALQRVAQIAPRPLLLVHSVQDPVVPVADSEKLYQKAGEPKKLVIIEGSEHRLRLNQAAMDTVINWLKEQNEH